MVTNGDSGAKQSVSVGGRKLSITNLDKVLYPDWGTTKGDVLHYYAKVAPLLIAAARDRPATRKRWVHGVGTVEHPGQMFFQKNLEDSAPDWVPRGTIHHKDHSNVYPLVNDEATLTWLAQIAALEIHVPQWRFGSDGRPRNPDRLVLDLDPGPEAGLVECAEVARWSRAILKDMGLDPIPVTSGSKGIHLYSALPGNEGAEKISALAHELARALEADHAELVVSDMKKSLRLGKVLVDWSQNNPNKTTVVPYSLRGRSTPTVACPRSWRELSSAGLAQLDYQEVLRRVSRRKDPFAAIDDAAGSPSAAGSTPPAGKLPVSEREALDRLGTYRSKRSADKTPEPVPAEGTASSAPSSADAPIFVIQRHDASRLHYDFRLEHDGVLVSWALPKGVPMDTGKNHLAVQTEDHPMGYATFAGEIPAGQYGGGQVEIWDSGTFELEKWRDNKEVIAVLHGAADGGLGSARRFALIHTGGNGRSENNWLIHLMKEQPAAGKQPTGKAPSAGRQVPPSPMLARPGSVAAVAAGEGEWVYEMKWDGVRVLAVVHGGTAVLFSRNGIDVTATYPDVAEALEAADDVHDCILDGEIVAEGKGGRPDFSLLQRRMKLTKARDVAAARRDVPVRYFVFDLLNLRSRSLLDKPLHERRGLLAALVGEVPKATVQFSPEVPGPAEEALGTSRDLGLEGIIAKRRDSTYSPGSRGPAWLKIKHSRTQEVVVVGMRPGQGSRHGFGSLLLAVPDGNGELKYAGRVGTGFGNGQLESISAELGRAVRKTPPLKDVPATDARDAQWVSPRLVGEVQYTEWTSGGRLRHPSWRGWRPDKEPAEVRREDQAPLLP